MKQQMYYVAIYNRCDTFLQYDGLITSYFVTDGWMMELLAFINHWRLNYKVINVWREPTIRPNFEYEILSKIVAYHADDFHEDYIARAVKHIELLTKQR